MPTLRGGSSEFFLPQPPTHIRTEKQAVKDIFPDEIMNDDWQTYLSNIYSKYPEVEAAIAEIQVHDQKTAIHSLGVARVFRKLWILTHDKEPEDELFIGALLHDYGKLQVDQLHLNSPKKFSRKHRDLFFGQHPEDGYRGLVELDHPEAGLITLRHHSNQYPTPEKIREIEALHIDLQLPPETLTEAIYLVKVSDRVDSKMPIRERNSHSSYSSRDPDKLHVYHLETINDLDEIRGRMYPGVTDKHFRRIGGFILNLTEDVVEYHEDTGLIKPRLLAVSE